MDYNRQALAGLVVAEREENISTHFHTVIVSCFTVHTHRTTKSDLWGGGGGLGNLFKGLIFDLI